MHKIYFLNCNFIKKQIPNISKEDTINNIKLIRQKAKTFS
jgi:hypothetical protein